MTRASILPRPDLRHLWALMIATVILAAVSLMPQMATAEPSAGEMPPMVQVVESPKSFVETVDAFRV